MSRRQTVFFILAFFALLWGFGLTLYLSGDANTARVGSPTATPRFTAKEGTTRDNAVALVSSARKEGVDTYPSTAGGAPETAAVAEAPISSQSLSKPQETFHRDMAEAILDRIAAEDDPVAQAEALKNALGTPQSGEVEALLRLRLGAIYEADTSAPRDQVLAEYRRAFDVAEATEAKLEAAQHIASLTRILGRPDEARTVIVAALDEADNAEKAARSTVRAMRLTISLGDMGREMGEVEIAERAYSSAVEAGMRVKDANFELRDTLRLAGMRLVALLREQGRHEAAEEVGRRVQSRLRAMEASG